MKFSCSAEALQRGINVVQNAVGTKISNPIVENIKLDVSKDKLTFYGTNLSLHARCISECMCDQPGAVALPTDYLVSTFRELSPCEVKVAMKGPDILFQTPSGEVKLRWLPPDDFPEFETGLKGSTFELPVGTFREICRKTLFATSPEKARFELDGVKWVVSGGQLVCVATDGRRLSHLKTALPGVESELTMSALIPSKALTELARVVPGEGNISVTLSKNKGFFECGDVAMTCALLEDRFPPYEQIIPTKFEITLELARETFLHAVRMVGALADDRTKMVKISLNKNRMVLQGEQEQVGIAREEIEIDYDGTPMTVGYKASFLLDILRVLDEEKLKLNLINPGSPGVIKAGEEDWITHVVMPMQISDDA